MIEPIKCGLRSTSMHSPFEQIVGSDYLEIVEDIAIIEND